MARVLWKGAISFGLVHVPVALLPAEQSSGIDFDWLDRRSLDPVGYKKYNKRTGKELKAQDIVKGIKQPNGDYVVLSDEEIRAAFPTSTQTIEIDAFVKAAEVPVVMFERPYFLEPASKAERVYALLRDAMRDAAVIAVARLVMHTKEHLAVLIPSGPALVLNTIRWAGEIRPTDGLKLPGKGLPAPTLKPAERKMASQLIDQMTASWKPAAFAEHFSTAIRGLVKRKIAAGEAQHVEPLENVPGAEKASNVVDHTELLARSLSGRSQPLPKSTGDAPDRRALRSRLRKRVPRRRAARAIVILATRPPATRRAIEETHCPIEL